MNLNRKPTVEELREVIRRGEDDAGHHVLWVTTNGDVQLTRITEDQSQVDFEKTHPNVQIRFETFQAGNEYVGPEAANDGEWLAELFGSLVKKWQKAKGKSEVVYVDITGTPTHSPPGVRHARHRDV